MAVGTSDRDSDAGRVVVVTGAGKGLGAAFAAAWARRGARVLVNNRHGGTGPASAEVIAATLRAAGTDAVADRHAVDAPEAAAAIVAATLAAFGRLDALILNAGITGPAAKIPAQTAAALADVMAINFFANAALAAAALPYLAAAPAGRILFVASTAGLYGVRGRSAYAASKGALTAYALSLAAEQRRAGIGVNVLCPYAATAMTAGSGPADPRFAPGGAAAAAVWLTSAACPATGEIWVAGGDRARRAVTAEGAMVDASTPAMLAAAPPPPPLAGFAGGEAAFADFARQLEET